MFIVKGEVDGDGEPEARQTAVLAERNGHKVVIHSRTPSISSKTADV